MSDIDVGAPVPEALAAAEVVDTQGQASPLGTRWAQSPAVIVFLRHFACVACSEHVTALAPRLHELTRLGVAVVYVGNGADHFMQGFVERNAIDLEQVELVTDPTLKVHKALHLTRSWTSAYGVSALGSLARAVLKGFRQSSIDGDQYQQGGVLVVERGGRIEYLHRDQHTGDHAPIGDVIDAAMRVALDERAVV